MLSGNIVGGFSRCEQSMGNPGVPILAPRAKKGNEQPHLICPWCRPLNECFGPANHSAGSRHNSWRPGRVDVGSYPPVCVNEPFLLAEAL